MCRYILALVMGFAVSGNTYETPHEDSAIEPETCYTYWRTTGAISDLTQARAVCPNVCGVIGAYWNGGWRSIDANTAKCSCTLC